MKNISLKNQKHINNDVFLFPMMFPFIKKERKEVGIIDNVGLNILTNGPTKCLRHNLLIARTVTFVHCGRSTNVKVSYIFYT